MRFSKQTQRGFSLIELMVSLALSMAVLAGVAKMFMGQTSSARTQDATSQVQETARLIFDVVGDSIKHAGHLPLPINSRRVTSYGQNDYKGVTNQDSVSVVNNGLRDAITLSFATRDTYIPATGVGGDCTGAAPVAGVEGLRIVNAFSVNANNELVCTNSAGVSTIVAAGVLQFNLRLGMSAIGPGSEDSVIAYQEASAFSSANSASIKAIEVCMVLQSSLRAGESGASNNQYLGCDGVSVNVARDGFYRQTFRQVISVRNNLLSGV